MTMHEISKEVALMEAQMLQSQIVYFREEIEERRRNNEPYSIMEERLNASVVRLNQLLAGI